MNKRSDYEHLEEDLDHNYYFIKNKDVYYAYTSLFKEIEDFGIWFTENEKNKGLFYTGTALYFTYHDKKYYVSWTWYQEELIKRAIKKLKKLGATNIQINFGELD